MLYTDENALATIGGAFPQLRALRLHMCTLSDKAIGGLQTAERTKQIDCLILNTPDELSASGLYSLVRHCVSLRKLALTKCPSLTNAGLVEIAPGLSQLTELKIDNSPSIYRKDDRSHEQLTDRSVQLIAEHCPLLRLFSLSRSSALTSAAIHVLCCACPRLLSVSLNYCSALDDAVFSALLQLKQLKRLTLQNCKITPRGVVNLLLRAGNLIQLTLRHYGNEFCGDFSQLMDDTFETLEREGDKLRPSVLQQLSAWGVGGYFLWFATVLCPKLSCLEFDTKMSPFHFSSILKNCESLTKLELTSTSIRLDEKGLDAIAKYGMNLRKINFGTTLKSINFPQLNDILKTCRCLQLMTMNLSDTDIEREIAEVTRTIERHRGTCLSVVRATGEDHCGSHCQSVALHFLPSIYIC